MKVYVIKLGLKYSRLLRSKYFYWILVAWIEIKKSNILIFSLSTDTSSFPGFFLAYVCNFFEQSSQNSTYP